MAKRDFYEVLGVNKGADEAELKKAYRSKAKELHPDRNKDKPEAEAQFKEVNEAYDILKNPQKKAAYDQFGHAAFEGGMGGPGGPGGFGGGAGAGPDFASAFSDVFDDLFGDFMGGGAGRRSGGPRQRATRGSDLRYNLKINLENAWRGKKTTIRVPSAVLCEKCGGSGAKGGAEPVQCPTCSGMGKVRAQQGFFTIERTCPTCSGRGMTIKDPCGACAGQGRVNQDRSLSVKIPEGVEEGTRIRLAGEGEAGLRGGPTGDLYIFIQIKPHDLFERDGMDLHCRIPVPMATATLGGEIVAPTIDGGRTKVKVPAGAQNGKQLRLRGKGMPKLHGGRFGDLYLELAVETPVNLSSKQKELLKEFEQLGAEKNSPESSGFFNKVREFWDGVKG